MADDTVHTVQLTLLYGMKPTEQDSIRFLSIDVKMKY